MGGGVTIDRAEASIGLPPRVLRIPPYHCFTVDRRSDTSGRLHHLPMSFGAAAQRYHNSLAFP